MSSGRGVGCVATADRLNFHRLRHGPTIGAVTKSVRLCVALSLAGLLLPTPASLASVAPRVVGGTNASGSMFRAVVQIQTTGNQLCTGTLISDQWVLTAGHCIADRATIAGGATSQNQLRSLGGATGIRHPDYLDANNMVRMDVGLYRLDSRTTLGSNVPALASVSESWAWAPGAPVTLAGWGRTVVGGGASPTLQTTTLTVLSDPDCAERDRIEGIVFEASSSMCVNANGSSACEGDSGGPSYAALGATLVQVGITSYGIEGCAKHAVQVWLPGVVTWIRSVTKLPLGGTANNGMIPAVVRSFGMDRYESAAATAGSWESTSTVFLATGGNFPDSLAAGAAAARLGAPLLLVSATSVPESTELQLRRLKPTTIYVAGGPAAVSEAVLAQVQSITGVTPVRRFGQDRYETGESLTRLAWDSMPSSTVWVASGRNFVDPLIASAAGAVYGQPFLLVDGRNALSATQVDLVRSLGVTQFKVVGLADAVTATLIDDLKKLGTVTVFNLSDASRRSASVWSSLPSAASVSVATSLNFPDALSAVPYLVRGTPSPLFLVPGTCVPKEVKPEIARLGPGRMNIFGGPAAVGLGVEGLTQC